MYAPDCKKLNWYSDEAKSEFPGLLKHHVWRKTDTAHSYLTALGVFLFRGWEREMIQVWRKVNAMQSTEIHLINVSWVT